MLAAVAAYTDEHGYAPSLRDLMVATGLKSPSSVAYQLGELVRLGHLRRDPNRPRALAVVGGAS